MKVLSIKKIFLYNFPRMLATKYASMQYPLYENNKTWESKSFQILNLSSLEETNPDKNDGDQLNYALL